MALPPSRLVNAADRAVRRAQAGQPATATLAREELPALTGLTLGELDAWFLDSALKNHGVYRTESASGSWAIRRTPHW